MPVRRPRALHGGRLGDAARGIGGAGAMAGSPAVCVHSGRPTARQCRLESGFYGPVRVIVARQICRSDARTGCGAAGLRMLRAGLAVQVLRLALPPFARTLGARRRASVAWNQDSMVPFVLSWRGKSAGPMRARAVGRPV